MGLRRASAEAPDRVVIPPLSLTEKLFLSRLISGGVEREARRAVAPGRHDVEVTLRVGGFAVVGEPASRAPWLQNDHFRAILGHLYDLSPAVKKHLPAIEKAFRRDPERFRQFVPQAELGELFREMASRLPRTEVAGDIDASGLELDVLSRP